MHTTCKVKINLLTLLLLLMDNTAIAKQKILFGSCMDEQKEIPILTSINKEAADLFLFLGDNIYADTEDGNIIAEKYRKLAQHKNFKQLRKLTSVMAIWDDHDYGANDSGFEYPSKEISKNLFLNFWNEPKDSARRKQNDGIYTSRMINYQGHKIHIILPDLRWSRTPLTTVGEKEYKLKRIPNNQGPYLPSPNKNSSQLSQTQWLWLENQLTKPSDLTIIGSSIQVLSDFTGWESWTNFPEDKKRLLSLIKKHRVNGVILISGDTHWGEISRFDLTENYPLYELTSSGLSKEWKLVSPNRYRIDKPYDKVNYGEILIDWDLPDPQITLSLKDINGQKILSHKILKSSISPF